jgi:hypothetical protein
LVGEYFVASLIEKKIKIVAFNLVLFDQKKDTSLRTKEQPF